MEITEYKRKELKKVSNFSSFRRLSKKLRYASK
jgi:hypothetical protein